MIYYRCWGNRGCSSTKSIKEIENEEDGSVGDGCLCVYFSVAQTVSPKLNFNELKDRIELCKGMSAKHIIECEDSDGESLFYYSSESKGLFSAELSIADFILDNIKDDLKSKSLMREYLSMYICDITELNKHEKYYNNLMNSNKRKTSTECERKLKSLAKNVDATSKSLLKKWGKFAKKIGFDYSK